MANAANLTPDSRFFGLFIGHSGSGKTPSACSFANASKDKRVKVFDFDGRIRGILNTPWIDKSKIDYDYYPPIHKVGDKQNFQKLNDEFAALQVQCNMGQCPYNTLVLDSLTTQTFAFICDALPMTHAGKSNSGNDKGKKMGTMNIAGMEDYMFESTGTMQVLAFLRSLPIQNIIITAHIIDKYEKEDPENPFSPSIVKGSKLSLRDKLSANIPGLFDHVFQFRREFVGGQNKIFVNFWSDIARTVYPNLPMNQVDITGKSFYDVLTGYVNGQPK